MAQIITVTVKNDKNLVKECVFNRYPKIKRLLNEKGKGVYSFTAINTLISEEIIVRCYDETNYEDAWNGFKNKVLEKIENEWLEKDEITFIFFSKELSEIRGNSDKINIDPFIENERLIWKQGTVINLLEIMEALDKKSCNENQAIAYYDELAQKNIIIKGVFEAVVYDYNKKEIEWIHNGGGYWYYPCKCNDVEIIWRGTTANINILGSKDRLAILQPFNATPYYYEDMVFNKNEEELEVRYYIPFSGGMNSIFSSYVNIRDSIARIEDDFISIYLGYGCENRYKRKYIFVYFDYGTKASKQEIAAMERFYYLMKSEFPYIEFEYKIVDVKNLFEIFDNIEKIEDISFHFPYRNTGIAMLLGAMIEKDLKEKLFVPNIIFGLNSTESILGVGNSSAWLQLIEGIIAYGGKEYKYIDVIAPFLNVSKSNMIVFMIKKYGYDKTKELLDIAYSCVDPDKFGESCGKCLKCCLRINAFEEAKKYIMKNFFN